MAVHCFQYVCDRVRSGPKPRDPSPSTSAIRKNSDVGKEPEDDISFLEYPMLFWTDHARDASDDICEHSDVQDEFFQARSRGFQRWFGAYWLRTHAESEKVPGTFTAMHLAAYAGLSWLLSKLIESGHASIIQLLPGKGADCRPKDKIGWTPLHRTAFNGHTGVARVLLDNDVDIEAKDGTKWTALIRAANNGNMEVVQLLLAKDANVTIKDMEGCTPMHHAALKGHASISKLLLERGAHPEDRDNDGWTVLQHASWNDHEKMVRYLLKNGANVHSRADNGWTALHQARWNGHATVVGRLFKGCADPNVTDDEGETPSHQAAWRGHPAVMKLLLDEDADPNLRDRTGQTALHQAASNDSKAVVQLLLDEGADPRVQDDDNRKPRSLAEENIHHQIAQVLRDRETEVYGDEVFPDTDNIPKTALPDSHVDSAIIAILSTDPETAMIEAYGQAGFAAPSKVTTVNEGEVSVYFMKTGPDGEIFKGRATSVVSTCCC